MAVFRPLLFAFGLLASTSALVAIARPADAAMLRVGVVDHAASVLFSASLAAQLLDERGHVYGHLGALESWQAREENGRLNVYGPKGQHVIVAGSLKVQPADGPGIPLVFMRSRWYRGALELRASHAGVTAVNLLGIEQYLYGVVPSEMPHQWNAESLKSQAVAARSYALANLGKHRSRGFDVCATDDCQVYGGAAAEAMSSNQAVDATRDQVITYAGKVVSAYFCASTGGYTENSEDVWSRKLPYIRAVPDFDQGSPHFSWYKTVGAVDLASGLARYGFNVGQLLQVNPGSRSYSGRVREVTVVGTAGTKTVPGETFRMAAGLNSTLFNVAPVGSGEPSGFTFAGRGWGHGLGMSQWGAKNLGEKGYSYLQILGHYYPGAQLGKV